MPEQITAYKCRYCGARFVRIKKHAVERHEQYCQANPENVPACWQGGTCARYIPPETYSPDDTGSIILRHYHYCSYLDCEMASKRMLARKNIISKHLLRAMPEREMPRKCRHFEDRIAGK